MKKAKRERQPKPMRRFLQLHYKLLVCLMAGVLAALLLPAAWTTAMRLLVGWDIAIVFYLTIIYFRVAPCGVEKIRQRAAVQDEGAVAILLLTMIAAFASLAALVVLLGDKTQTAHEALRLSVAISTIVLSWMFMHTIFTLHYAHEYYGDRADAQHGGLLFPGRQRPDYWDFLYFSLVIAMTSQVSDVAISSKIIRRVATMHGVLSFFFNLGILALTINMLASAIS
jgi:uncharacterized membrane protein